MECFVPGYWINARGQVLPVSSIPNDYLQNIIRFLQRWYAEEEDMLVRIAIRNKIDELEDELICRDN